MIDVSDRIFWIRDGKLLGHIVTGEGRGYPRGRDVKSKDYAVLVETLVD